MNIAFYTYYECIPTKGGTERTTSLVAKAMTNIYNHKCYSIYSSSVDIGAKEKVFTKTLKITNSARSIDELVFFIINNHIDVVINQGDLKFGLMLNDIITEKSLNCIQIFAYHYKPCAWEESCISFSNIYKKCKIEKNYIQYLKIILYPIYYYSRHKKLISQFRKLERKVAKIVLLSPKFIDEWISYVHGSNSSNINEYKFGSIPNALSFNYFAKESDIILKEKRVLIVSRLEENPKKISKALHIWKICSDNPKLKDWQLDIVGDGSDKDLLISIVKKYNIPRVNFYGKQDPEYYYKRSAIFLMTSDNEGFGMTLTEASQYGLVPFAYNTFASLSDIINNGINGFIFAPNNYKEYAEKLENLILNNQLRHKIAMNAVAYSKKFSLEGIATRWQSMICDLKKSNTM